MLEGMALKPNPCLSRQKGCRGKTTR